MTDLDKRIDELNMTILKTQDDIYKLLNKKKEIDKEIKYSQVVCDQLKKNWDELIEQRVRESKGFSKLSKEDKELNIAVAKLKTLQE